MTPTSEMIEAARKAYVTELPETALYPSEFAMRAALTAALALLSGEPVAWEIEGSYPLCGEHVITKSEKVRDSWAANEGVKVIPLYAAPAPQEVKSREESNQNQRLHAAVMDGFDMEAARIGRAAFGRLVDLDLADDTSNDADFIIDQIETLVAPAPQPVSVKALKEAEEEFNRIACENITETRNLSDVLERIHFFANRGAVAIRSSLSSPVEGGTETFTREQMLAEVDRRVERALLAKQIIDGGMQKEPQDLELKAVVDICRSVAEDMIEANIQWRLDPRYILRLCNAFAFPSPAEIEALRVENGRFRDALAEISSTEEYRGLPAEEAMSVARAAIQQQGEGK